MPSWDSDLYLRFTKERTQPVIDLAARVELDAPARIVDLGCGPGNSTVVLGRRWPRAKLTGIDDSAAMLASARTVFPQWTWVADNISTWRADEQFDVVFSNAALQWVPNHEHLFPRLLEQVAPGGALAVQMPANVDAPPHRLMLELAGTSAWQDYFPTTPRVWHVHPPEFYYDTLTARATRLAIWTIEYLHRLDSVDSIIDWYRGTGLRPWLDALPDEDSRRRFLADYRELLVPHFPSRGDGKVLLPFRRVFIVAYR